MSAPMKMKKPAAANAARETASRQIRNHLEVIRFLAASGKAHDAEEIRRHLEHEIGLEVDLRTVQRWLKEMREDSEHLFHDYIRVRPASAAEIGAGRNRRTLLAEASGKPLPASLADPSASGGEIVSATTPGLVVHQLAMEEAWLLMLAERVLDKLIPQEFFDHGLQKVFREARGVLATDPTMRRLASRIVYVPRGQRLYEAPEQARANEEIVAPVMQAIREGKMLSFLYRGQKPRRRVHPCALVYREPKLYLRAIQEGGADEREFLCARMGAVEVLARNSEVPGDYQVDPDTIDLAIHGELGLPVDRKVPLVLRLHAKGRPNLVDDLQRYRLDPQQTLTDLGEGDWQLAVPSTWITTQLVEWIAGRGDAVTVVGPDALAEWLRKK